MAIRVAHHLHEKNIPAYFVSVRGMESKEDLVSKLLSMFADDKQVGHISSSHFSIQCLQQVQNPFVLIFDNADDLLESGDTKRKEHVLQFIDEILTHCKQIKLLLTTRESLDYLKHKLPMYSERINVLDQISSEDLVRLLLPDASDEDYNCIVRECGNVPMSMQLMCSIIKEESISIHVLLQELNNSTLVEVLDHEYLPDSFRMKSVMNTSFKRLMVPERDAFVSLSVFPERFGVEEAQAILNEKSEVQTKQIIRSLERKSLIDCGANFSHFTVHSLFRSFIQEETKNDQEVEDVFRKSQIQFYDYYISRCKVANEHFLKERYGDAFRDFLDRRSSIISSLSSGPRIDRIYSKVVELLSEAKSFLSVALHDEQMLLERLYDTAVEEANKRGNLEDKQKLQSAQIECPTAESFFWLSRVHREGGNLKEAKKSAKVGSQIREEPLGHSPNRAVTFYHRGVTYNVMGYNDILVKALQKAEDLAKVPQPSYYNVLTTERSSKGYHEGYMGGLQYEAYMRLHLDGVNEETARCFLRLARKQREAGNLTGALESVKVGIRLTQERSPGHPDTASALFQQGEIHYAMGDKKSAVQAFQKAAAMFSQLHGCHINTAHCYFNLGMAQYEMRDLQGALNSLRIASNMRSHLLHNNTEKAALTYYALGEVQRNTGDLKGAMESLQSAVNIRSNLLGDHGDAALAYYKLGLVQRDMGDLKGALESLQRAANIRSKLLSNHRDTALAYYSLGLVQRDMGGLKGALESLQKAANIRSKLLGDHRDTALAYYSLGLVQRDMGDLKGAMESLQKAANIRSKLLGDHGDTALAYYKLGLVQRDMGDLKGALDSLQRVANMASNLLGDHKTTAIAYYTVGIVQSDIGDLKGAVESLQSAANIRSKLLGDHGDTALAYYKLGVLQRDMGDLKGAFDSFQRAANMRSNLLGDHEYTASSYYWLGLVQRDMGDHNGAMKSLQSAANIRSKLLGDHKDTALSYFELGLVQREMGDLKGAFDSFQRAANMRSNLLGDHEDTALSYYFLGLVQRDMGDHINGAMKSLQSAANIRSKVLGDHKDTALSYYWLGLVQRDMGDLKGALDSLQKAANIQSNLLGDHEDTAYSYHELGLVLRDMGDLKGALNSLQRAANKRTSVLGDHEDTARSYHELGLVQRKMGDLKGAFYSLEKEKNMRLNLFGGKKVTSLNYHELGVVQRTLGDLKGALESFQNTSDMRSNLLDDHQGRAFSLTAQRDVRNLKDLEAAKSLQRGE